MYMSAENAGKPSHAVLNRRYYARIVSAKGLKRRGANDFDMHFRHCRGGHNGVCACKVFLERSLQA